MNPDDRAPASMQVRNEFAAVELRVVPYGRGTRLEVTASRLGSTGALDATVLEALATLSEHQLAEIVALATEHRGPDATS